MGTDTGHNLLEPGDTPHDNVQFLFFCSAVIQAVNKHQGLLRASVATAGQDHRLGANEAPPAIISIFLGAELLKVFTAIEKGEAGESKPGSLLGLGTPVLPPLPMHGGDRNRTSPFAFTGNKFEFRALGSSMSLALPNTVLNTIVAEAIDELADALETATKDGKTVEEALPAILQRSFADNKRIVFEGDNYADEWHAEAEQRGLLNLRTTPDALPQLLEKSTVGLLGKYDVLSERELESRFEVMAEQYATKLNIEAETLADMARTMVLPAALRQLALAESAQVSAVADEVRGATDDLVEAIHELEKVNSADSHAPHEDEVLEHAKYMRDSVLPAMAAVRESADKLERMVADDLWPLPRYSEMLFIK
jgi:glutamine synthetase